MEIKALMTDGQDIRGRFFLSDQAQNHYGQEYLLEVLNHTDDRFIPFMMDDDETVVLMQKTRIVGLQPSDLKDHDWPHAGSANQASWPAAQIIMAGRTVDGWAFTGDLQPENRRLTDLLNHCDSFFFFDSDSGPWIINKTHLNFLVPQS